MNATLFADRFLPTGGEKAIDLASGCEVALRFPAFDDRCQLHAWLQRCAGLMDPQCRSHGRLADFGAAPAGHFEARCCGSGRAHHGTAVPTRHEPNAGAVLARVAAKGLLARFAEVLETGVSGRPRSLQLTIPRGVDHAVLVHLVARESRLRGYIPVNPARLQAFHRNPALAPAIRSVLHGRHVVVLHERMRAGGDAAAHLFLWLGLDSQRPHVLLVLGEEGVNYSETVMTRHTTTGLRAREQQAGYGPPVEAPLLVSSLQPPPDATGWSPALPDADLARPRSKILLAVESASRGRHASAARTLRETLGMFTRRDDLPGAAETALVLGRVMLTRGQVAEAAASFENARLWFDRAGLPSRAVAAAIFVGLAWTDAGRWLEAEAAIRSAAIAAAASGDGDGSTFAALALSRCLLWQARHREAIEALPASGGGSPGLADRVAEGSAPAFRAFGSWLPARLDDGVVRGCLEARIAMASENLRAAGRAAAAARERATLSGRPAEVAAACTAMAAVYAALGDARGMKPQVEEGVRAARLAHAPLRALRLRAVLAEGLLRAGKAAEARGLVSRLGRLDLAHLPVVVRAPLERVLQWKGGAVEGGTRSARSTRANAPAPEIVETVVEVLGFCQSIEDEEALAHKVVATLRARTGAAVTACFGLSETGVAAVAADGREPVPGEVAQRAGETGLAIAPGATASGLEAAVPVRCNGRIIGALGCRWPADVAPDWPSSGAMLAAAAAALAPCLRSVLDRRAAPIVPADASSHEIVGVSQALRALREEIARAARAPFNVVIEGESGSGKELVARAIHRLGPRRHHRLCAINCAALTDELLEAELFGHARGAFTGAVAERKGLFEEADGGTLVLDEVGELTPRAQAKLLRAIQEGEVRRIGENFSRPVDARIIAASNRALRPAAAAGAFRRDLLYRLEVIRIIVPPLRERVEDIPLLASHFWQQATARLGTRATLAPATLAALARYDWPGNVRELQNAMAALAVAAGRRGSVGPERLPAIIAGEAAAVRTATLDEARRLFEVRFVRAALARAGGHRARAARDLGLTRQGLAKLLTRLGIGEVEAVVASASPITKL